MKLLVDANLSPSVAEGLRAAGFEAVHVVDFGLVTASDDEIFDRASAEALHGRHR
jgi:predicted nuclease of predicted toxin-antitoxin system